MVTKYYTSNFFLKTIELKFKKKKLLYRFSTFTCIYLVNSVKWMEVPDYKIGDTIDMKLMRKSKGSVYVCPKFEWRERSGVPHNFKGKV